MKRKINYKHLAIVITSVILLVLTPMFIRLANQTRITSTFGGEAFIWLMPWLLLINEIKEVRELVGFLLFGKEYE